MDVDVVVVGAGAVGLAVAAVLARAGQDALVLEAADGIGTGTSARNSEVIHAGMYYPTGSLKHQLCTAGRRALYAYLQQRNIAHRKCGKLIVATRDAEIAKIETIHAMGKANGVEDLTLPSAAEAKAMEPALNCTAALWSPETGIIDARGYMLALQGEIEDHGGAIALQSRVVRVEQLTGGFRVHTPDASIVCRQLVNSAGLYAQKVASHIDGLSPENIPQLILAKGNYFSCAAKPVFSRLIYPAPVDGGLGVHVTLDLAGRMRFGPDVEWLADNTPDAIDYTVDPRRADAFYSAVRRYWPSLPDGVMLPDYSGVRPKIATGDFRIDGPALHGVPGLVNLFGIESPGLTSSLAIADAVHLLLE